MNSKYFSESNDQTSPVDVVFHRTESPEVSKDPEQEIVLQQQSSLRPHGRSISREDCTKKVFY